MGDIDIAVSSTSSLSTMYKDYYLFDTPYLFLNSDEVYDIGFGGEAGEDHGRRGRRRTARNGNVGEWIPAIIPMTRFP